jgi:hypothetical protein
VIKNFTGKPRWFFLRLATTHSLGHLYEAGTVRTLITGAHLVPTGRR